MARPRGEEPTVVVSVRLPVSVVSVWLERAKAKDRSLGEHLRVKLSEAARG